MHATLPEAVRAVIRQAGKSLSELALYSTVDKGIISRFLSGERSMTLETAQRLLEALGCTVRIKRADRQAPLVRVRRKGQRR